MSWLTAAIRDAVSANAGPQDKVFNSQEILTSCITLSFRTFTAYGARGATRRLVRTCTSRRCGEVGPLDLLHRRRQRIGAGEAQATLSHLRDQFSEDNLPTTVELADVDESIIVLRGAGVCVHQMRWVACTEVNLRKAIVDYYRAVTQAIR